MLSLWALWCGSCWFGLCEECWQVRRERAWIWEDLCGNTISVCSRSLLRMMQGHFTHFSQGSSMKGFWSASIIFLGNYFVKCFKSIFVKIWLLAHTCCLLNVSFKVCVYFPSVWAFCIHVKYIWDLIILWN